MSCFSRYDSRECFSRTSVIGLSYRNRRFNSFKAFYSSYNGPLNAFNRGGKGINGHFCVVCINKFARVAKFNKRKQFWDQFTSFPFREIGRNNFFATSGYTYPVACFCVRTRFYSWGVVSRRAMLTYLISDCSRPISDRQMFNTSMGWTFKEASEMATSTRHFCSEIQISFRGEAIRGYTKISFVNVASGMFGIQFLFINGLPFRSYQRASSTSSTRSKAFSSISCV